MQCIICYIIGQTHAQGQPHAKWYLYVTISGLTLPAGVNFGQVVQKTFDTFEFCMHLSS